MPRTFDVKYDCPTCGHAKNTARIEVTGYLPLEFSEGLISHGPECGKPCYEAAADGEHYDRIEEAVEAYLDHEDGPYWRHDDDWAGPGMDAGGSDGANYEHQMREARKLK